MRPIVVLVFTTLSCILLTPSPPAGAQADAEYLTAINFRFQNPGARARGLGGAFVALADDATTAIVNPAGLSWLDRAEISIEYAIEEDEFPGPRTETGIIPLPGIPPSFQQEFAPRRADIATDSENPSFVSLIFPVKKSKESPKKGEDSPKEGEGSSKVVKNPITLGFFYSKSLDTSAGQNRQAVTVTNAGATFPSIDSGGFFFPTASFVSAKNEVIGVSGGFRFKQRFSLGVSIGVSEFDFLGVTERRDLDGSLVNTQVSTVDEETDIFFTVGGLVKLPHGISIAASVQNQTGYDMASELDERFVDQFDKSFASEFTIPTRFTFGIAYVVTPVFVIAAEVDRIEYSDLFDETRGLTFFGDQVNDTSYAFAISDVTEIHLGAEYSFADKWSLRAGYWQDETHPPFYAGQNDLLIAWAPELGESVDHVTAGIGFEASHFVIDIAGDFSSDAGNDFLASLVIRFGKDPR